MRWLVKLFKHLTKLTWRSRIPPLPRMASSEYSRITPDEARVMIRYGIRSPSGLKTAMRKHQAATLDDLVMKLEHHQAKRQFQRRWRQSVQRLSGGTVSNPHTGVIKQIAPKDKNKKLLQERIRGLREEWN